MQQMFLHPFNNQIDKFQQAVHFHQQGLLQQAEVLSKEVLHTQPQHQDALHLLAVITAQRGQTQYALDLLNQAIALNPENGVAHSNSGLLYQSQKRYDEALASYDRALAINPHYAQALYHRGNAFTELKRYDEALANYEHALKIQPNYLEVLCNYGALLNQLERYDQALAVYAKALQIKPNYAEVLYNQGIVYKKLQRYEDALASYARALTFKPDYADVFFSFGNVLTLLKRDSEAIEKYQQAIVLKKDFLLAHYSLIDLLRNHGQIQPANHALNQALAAIPNDVGLHFLRLILTLTLLQHTAAESAHVVRQFDQALSALEIWVSRQQRQNLAVLTQLPPPFLLAYRPGNHVARLSRYGDLVAEKTTPVLTSNVARKKIKLLIISAYFYRHSVWDVITRGLLRHCDRSQFEIVLYHLSDKEDQETLLAKSLADQWRAHLSLTDSKPWLTALAEDAPDVIFYPEIGMDALTARLAAHRCAPLQVTSWGHPITSGFPTIDLYFSGELLESASADSHYREKLIRLPNAGCCTEMIPVTPELLAEQLEQQLQSPEMIRFVLPQAVYKFDPADDELYVSIAKRVPNSVFILFENPQLFPWAMPKIVQRLAQAFINAGLNPQQQLCVMPIQPKAKFYHLLDLVDVYLDTPSFSGYTTAWQAVHRGLPIVTLEGEFMRQRLSAGLLRRMGMTETVVNSRVAYVDCAVKLAEECRDKARYAMRRHALKTAAASVDHDLSVVRAFEQHLITHTTQIKEKKSANLFNNATQTAVLQHALACHQQGKLDQAAVLYEKILQNQPQHADALHLLGVIASQRGQHSQAIALISESLQLNSNNSAAYANIGLSFQAENRFAEALASYDRALQIDPRSVQALSNRGITLAALQRYDEAIASYSRALRRNPRFVDAFYNRGNAFNELKRYDEAIANYDSALKIKPDYADALYNRGVVLNALKRYDEALASYERAISIRPDYAQALYNRGNVLKELKRYEEAIASYDRALNIQPDNADVLHHLGNIFSELKRYDEALLQYEKALTLKPDNADVFYHRGNALVQHKQYDEAFASYDRALSLKPDFVNAHWNKSFCQLLLGDFANGWRNYEWRWKTDDFKTRVRNFTQPKWLGEQALQGKTILLYAEQGLGDTLQFCRYLEKVKALGATVLLEVQPELKTLLKSLAGVDVLLAKGETLPEFDYHCPLLSLPLALKTILTSIPATVPYLFADFDKTKFWQHNLAEKTLPRVGLVWSGNPFFKDDAHRSLSLEQLESLLSIETVEFFCLQKEIRSNDLETLKNYPNLRCFSEQMQDFSDTAALLAQMDLVISTCTSVAHLAGAMAKPTWVLLSYHADWRWLVAREDSPWYPSARLFRQPQRGNWQAVIERVSAELIQLKI